MSGKASLAVRAAGSALWSAADIFSRQGLQFLVAMVLARLLMPEDFGIVAMLQLFVGVATLISEGGLSAAVIQRQDTTHTDENAFFWYTIGASLAAAAALWAGGPWIAGFFGEPLLAPLAGVMALNLAISAPSVIHIILLRKQLNFRLQMKIGLAASLISGTAAIAMAWHGFGIWSLVFQIVISSAVITVLMWTFNPWRPTFSVSLIAMRRLFGFGGYMLASGLLDLAYSRLHTILIGKFFAARDLGMYVRAEGTRNLPISLLNGLVDRVAFPIFSVAAADKPQLQRGLMRVQTSIMFFTTPAMLGMAVVADPLVVTLFGQKWQPAAAFLQVLCVAGIFLPSHVINLYALMAQGRSDLYFRLELIKKVIGVAAVLAASLHSIMAIAWSQVAVSVACFFINTHYSCAFLAYGAWRQLRDLLPQAAVALVMAVLVEWLRHAVAGLVPALQLAVLVPAGALLYVGMARLAGLKEWREMTTLVGARLRGKFSGSPQ